MLTLIDHIAHLMSTDDDDRADQSRRLREAYEIADHDGRKRLDEAFIALCGWSLTTLIHNNA